MSFDSLTHTIHELVIDASLMMNEQNVQYQVKVNSLKIVVEIQHDTTSWLKRYEMTKKIIHCTSYLHSILIPV